MELSIDTMLTFFARLIVIFTAMPFHEYAHAFVADKLGDHTARSMGRLSLNPITHLDPIGAVAIFFFGFGWAKPVPINANNFKNPKAGMAVSAAAGPISNLIMAYIAMIIYKVIYFSNGGAALDLLGFAFNVVVSVNISLAIFNLIPIPPLDGSRIATLFLSQRAYFGLMRYERYLPLLLILLLMIPQVQSVFSTVVGWVFTGMNYGTIYIDMLFGLYR